MGRNIIPFFLALSLVKLYISDYISLVSARMASHFFSSTECIFCYICNFNTLSSLACAHYVRNSYIYIRFLEISKRCATCAEML